MSRMILVFAVVFSSWAVADEPVHDHFTTSDEIRIHYWVMGSGPPVVLIHGFSGSSELWLNNGVANALKKSHRVVALDCRGHGSSDKPYDPSRYGPQMAEDVIELMDHLAIKKAHVHGYAMGGGIVTQILARHPDRVITATYGGSGVREVAPEWQAKVPPDKDGPDPLDAEARAMLRASSSRDDRALEAVRAYPWNSTERDPLDLTKVTVPVLAINGEYDGYHAKTHRMKRELANFTNVMLVGKSHYSAIAPGHIPDRYIEATVEFVKGDQSKGGSQTSDTIDFKKKKNPIPYAKKSIARGKMLFTRLCAECHGRDGKALLDVIANATDLTTPEFWLSGTTEGEVFRSIRDGAGESMPPFEDQITKEEDIWHIVNFTLSLWPASARGKLQE